MVKKAKMGVVGLVLVVRECSLSLSYLLLRMTSEKNSQHYSQTLNITLRHEFLFIEQGSEPILKHSKLLTSVCFLASSSFPILTSSRSFGRTSSAKTP